MTASGASARPGWPVPQPFLDRRPLPADRAWALDLGRAAARVAAGWHLRPDGAPWWGHMSVVWPVRTAAGDPAALKLGEQTGGSRAEALALRAWDGRGAVRLLADDGPTGARLLERLDAGTDLDGLEDDAAVTAALAGLLATLGGTPAPDGVPALRTEVQRAAAGLRSRGRAAAEVVGPRAVAAALETLDALAVDLADRDDLALVHGDLHALNVLSPGPGGPAAGARGWVAIDPRALAGVPEWDLVAPLRNRWAHAAATGDPGTALQQRLAVLAGTAGLDADLARACVQASAVDLLTWVRLDEVPGWEPFVPAWEVTAGWCDRPGGAPT